MTNRVGRPKLVENMTDEERIVYWQQEREREKQERQDRLDHLSNEQRAAIKRMKEAVATVMMAYHEMCHPSFGDIVELDNALWAYNRELNQED